MIKFFQITTTKATTLETGAVELMIQLWALCTSTLGRKFRALSDGVTVPGPVAEKLLLANDRDMDASNRSRNAMIFRGAATLTYTQISHFNRKIPAKLAKGLRELGAAVTGASVTLPNVQGIHSPDLYAAFCQLQALDIKSVRTEVCFDVGELGYSTIRNLHLYAAQYETELAALGIVHSGTEFEKALYYAKDRDALDAPCPTQWALGWDCSQPGDLFALPRIAMGFIGRAMFCAPGAFNLLSCKPGVGEMLREIRVTAGTMAQGSARGDRGIVHPACQRATDRTLGESYRKRTFSTGG